jgi:hypothetical protein
MGSARRKQACWTCRLRKKKCDEARPQCSPCSSLSIPCYDYGSKPDWMNNEESRQTVTDSLKQIVKSTSRRKPTALVHTGRARFLNLAPRLPKDTTRKPTSLTDSCHIHNLLPELETLPREIQYGHFDVSSTLRAGHFEQALSVPGSYSQLQLPPFFLVSAEKDILLMHFINEIFPLQYPLYKADIRQERRAWLLSLLFETQPLFDAALAFGSYHQHVVVLNTTPTQLLQAIEQRESYLNTSVTGLRKLVALVSMYGKQGLPKEGVGIVASMIQLIFFEVIFRTGTRRPVH